MLALEPTQRHYQRVNDEFSCNRTNYANEYRWRMEAMKRITHIVFVLALFTIPAGSLAAAQTTEPVGAQSSLGDYARKVHKDPNVKAKPKVFDNDNLPKEDKLSIVGEAAPVTAADASADFASKAAAAANGKDGAAATPATSTHEEQSKKLAEWKTWQEQLKAQNNYINLA